MVFLGCSEDVFWTGDDSGGVVDAQYLPFLLGPSHSCRDTSLPSNLLFFFSPHQVFSKLLYPIVREGALSVLQYMLLSFQHSHEAFHLVRMRPALG